MSSIFIQALVLSSSSHTPFANNVILEETVSHELPMGTSSLKEKYTDVSFLT